jgi:hypothetical protein
MEDRVLCEELMPFQQKKRRHHGTHLHIECSVDFSRNLQAKDVNEYVEDTLRMKSQQQVTDSTLDVKIQDFTVFMEEMIEEIY